MAKTFVVRDQVVVRAPVERCFRLACSIALVRRTLGMTRSEAESRQRGPFIEGVGDQVMWRGWMFGLPQMHETLITEWEPPRFFEDTMGRGRFAHFQHDHFFTPERGSGGEALTRMRDEVRFGLPLGWAGAMVGRMVMVPEVRGLVASRFALLKEIAEGEAWREILAEDAESEGHLQTEAGVGASELGQEVTR